MRFTRRLRPRPSVPAAAALAHLLPVVQVGGVHAHTRHDGRPGGRPVPAIRLRGGVQQPQGGVYMHQGLPQWPSFRQAARCRRPARRACCEGTGRSGRHGSGTFPSPESRPDTDSFLLGVCAILPHLSDARGSLKATLDSRPIRQQGCFGREEPTQLSGPPVRCAVRSDASVARGLLSSS
jgi:hypothetical protein